MTDSLDALRIRRQAWLKLNPGKHAPAELDFYIGVLECLGEANRILRRIADRPEVIGNDGR